MVEVELLSICKCQRQATYKAFALTPLTTKTMQRLSLAELKAQKESQVTANLEAIKGGNAAGCHTPPKKEKSFWERCQETLSSGWDYYNH
ncbi:MAG: hypothetical protein EAZ32_13375 [Cytophagia bacterium]|nr:MAG: hypothetical protein EAZ38_14385 [Cytophagales bacterium]TAG38096.1 MAG: hypothetical protein EAZ32_13375 [Cytophagia bacterium]TAG79527.1 MAG: hypothetical protein EAZ22_11340 [Cytophagales bacterium]